jgi:hypothetical protein
VNQMTKLHFPKTRGTLPAETMSAYKYGICSMSFVSLFVCLFVTLFLISPHFASVVTFERHPQILEIKAPQTFLVPVAQL